MFPRLILFSLLLCSTPSFGGETNDLKVGVFAVDASPPVGSPLAYDPTKGVQNPLSCRGIVLIGSDKPIVLCAVDWIGIGNGGQTEFKEKLAIAAGTLPDRVAVHALHQHDAPRCDFTVADALEQRGIKGPYDSRFARDVIRRAAEAVEKAARDAVAITHVGLGSGRIEQVASNRRVLGPDGKVKWIRWSATRDAEARAQPVGTIDPTLKLISFWNGDKPLAALTYYATHPQSYYRTGLASADFPGLARDQRQKDSGVPHIHFNGAGGNITAGKWNDGSKENRRILADRVAAGMKLAWKSTKKAPVTASDIAWRTLPVQLPVAENINEAELEKMLADESAKPARRAAALNDLTWIKRCRAGGVITLSCLQVGRARVLHMPGELFIEYQLASQKMRPELFVAMAAYGDYAPGYIGTEVSYTQGGYETRAGVSLTSPKVEGVLMSAMRKLLEP